MNCSACGTQLSEGAANCPQCGAATPYFYSHASSAPDDPTVVSPPYADTQQPPPPSLYGSPSDVTESQPLYASSTFHNPYDPYGVVPSTPPPPSSKRSGMRIGILVGGIFIGSVLLILLLIGGGILAWLAYSSANNSTAANATATARAATQRFTAKGTFTIVSRTTPNVQQDGQNKIYTYTQQEVIYGDISGTLSIEETSIVHPDNTSTFSGTSTCICTVKGKSGTYVWSYTGTSAADGSFQGQDFNGHGTGELAKLHGEQGVFQGKGLHGTYSSVLYFDV